MPSNLPVFNVDRHPRERGMADHQGPEGELHEQEAMQAAALVGLPIPSEYLSGVAVHFRVLRDRAEMVMSFPLPDDIEPAPVFRP